MPDSCYSNPEYIIKWILCQNNFLQSKINLKMSSAKLWLFRRRLNVVRRFDGSQSVRALLHKHTGVYKSSPSTADNILMTHLGHANPAVPASYCTRPGHINPSGTYFGHTQQLNLVISQPTTCNVGQPEKAVLVTKLDAILFLGCISMTS